MKKRSPKIAESHPQFQIEELEQRILLSADLGVGDYDPAFDGEERESVQYAAQENEGSEAESVRRELVIVDRSTPDHESLTADILAQQDDGREFNVAYIDSDRDGVEQLTEILSSYSDLDAVHLVSHGSDGQLQLGTSTLDLDAVFAEAGAIEQWGQAFTADGDLLIYGCDLAASDQGMQLVNSLANLTGADVAASDDLTGAADKGGDWDLEYNAGDVESLIAFSLDAQANFTGTLDTYLVTNTNATGAGSLEQAILDANANVNGATPDEIHFNIGAVGSLQTITVGASGLTWISESVILDGTTQGGGGYAGDPLIQLDGSATGASVNGITITGNDSTVKGFIIHSFGDEGFEVRGDLGGGDNNVIQNNWVGIDSNEDAAPNGDDGIIFAFGASGNIVGGSGANEANVFAGNLGSAIVMRDAGTDGNIIQGNFIGVLDDGITAVANGEYGVHVSTNVSGNQIGGVLLNEGNIIVGNSGAGVAIAASAGNDNAVLSNTIHSNGGIGIDIGADGVTNNDVNDGDAGANDLLNFAVILDVQQNGADLDVSFVLDAPAGNYRIEFFENPNGIDSSRNGQGENFLGAVTVTSAGTGPQSFSETLIGVTPAAILGISATTTADLGGGSYGSTSEFGNAFAGTGTLVVNTTSDASDGDVSSIAALLANKGADGVISLREAMIAANNTANGASPDEIHFDIGGGGLQKITLVGSGLPSIDEAVILDATTQSGYAGSPLIELDGSGVSATAGIWILSDGSTVKGFIIHSFSDEGIEIDLQTNLSADNNIIQNNWVGVDSTGAPMGNADIGILITDGAKGNLIGGSGPNEGNVVAGNLGDGIVIRLNSPDNVVEGNIVGFRPDGITAAGNAGQGIAILSGSAGNRIGGTTAGAGNTIAHNALSGVRIAADAGTNNSVLANSIYANDGLGIDVGADGVTTGYPTITSIIQSGSDLLITIEANVPAGNYRIEIFDNPAGSDPTGFGEGQVLLDAKTITHTGGGVESFNLVLSGVSPATTEGIAATITEDLGGSYGTTSEFGPTTADSSASIWFGTVGDVSSPSGNPDVDAWEASEALRLGGPSLNFGPDITAGTLSSLVDFDALGDGDVDINSIEYVSQAVTIGGTNFPSVELQEGDILFSTVNGETLGGVGVSTQDVVLFRPTVAGDYSAGTFSVLLDKPAGRDIWGITLVEQDTNIGDATVLAGNFLFTLQGANEEKSIWYYEVEDAADKTAGTLTEFIDGSMVGIDKNIFGIHLVEADTTIGAQSFLEGDLLLSLAEADTNIGTNALDVAAQDVFILRVSVTGTAAPVATAYMLVDGDDLGFQDADAAEAINGITLKLPGTPPVVAIDSLSTGDSTPVLTGTVDDAAAAVVVTVEGVSYKATNNGDGTWTLADNTISPALADGTYDITVTATDAEGNVGIDSTTDELVVDLTAPTVAIDSLITGDSTPALTGTINDNAATIVVTVAGTNYNATNNGNGTWTLADNTISPALLDGTYDIVVTATDAVGNVATDGTTDELVVDLTAPTVAIDNLTTGDSTPALTGTINDNAATIVVTVAGTNYNATNNGDGTWTLADNTISPALLDGTYDIVVTATDAQGNIGTDATTDELIVDLTAPVVAIDSLTTGDSTPALTGTVNDTTATILVTVAGTNYNATNNGNGTWTLADNAISPALLDGTYDIVVTATDTQGNIGTDATTDELVVDLTAPVVAIDALTTGDSTPSLTGTINDTTATIVVTVAGTNYNATNNGNGTWTLADNAISPALLDGTYDIVVTATDTQGNIGTDATTDELVVDLTAPVVAIDALTTGDSTPSLTGTINDATATIVVTVTGTNYNATNNGNGTWTLADNAISPALLDGTYDIVVTATDAQGNIGTDATTDELIVDLTAPVVAIDALTTGDSTPSLTGTINDTTATIVVTVAGTNYNATNNGNGTWTLADNAISPALLDGTYDIVVTATDAQGNIGTDATTDELVVDLTAPTVAIDSLTTGDSTPTLSGTINDNAATIVVTVAGTNYNATNNGDGTWTLADNSISPALLDGTYDIVVTATDAVGNVATDGTTDELVIDLTAPTVAIDSLTTGDSTPALTGTVNDNAATIVVTVAGTNYNATNNGDGTWTLADNTISPALLDGTYDIVVTATDAQGNIGTDGTTDELIVDLTAPVVTIVPQATNDATPALSGTVNDSSATIVVTVAGTNYNATNNGDGTWTLADNSISPALLDGIYDITVTATDAQGNIGTDATTDELVVDLTVPTVTIDSLTTGDSTPALTGTVNDTAATIVVTVAGTNYNATNNGDGTWTLADNAISPALLDGTYDIAVTATDNVGNIGTDATTDELIVDLIAPTVAIDALTTGDSTPALTGTIDDTTATIVVTVAGTNYNATNNGDGTWTLADNDISPALLDGTYDIVVTATDTQGNIGTDATTDELIVDLVAPIVTVDGLVTVDSTPQLTGTVNDASATIVVTVNGTNYNAVNNGNGTWVLADNTISPALLDGTYNVTVTATDAAGNAGTDLTIAELTVDTTAPVVTIDPLMTNDSTPALTGTVSDPLATVVVTIAGNNYNALNLGTGTWLLADNAISPALLDGTYDIVVTATDAQGNIGTDATINELLVDLSAPLVTVDILTSNDSTPALSGTVNDPAATIIVTVNGTNYNATNNGDGTWTLADNVISPALADGVYDVSVAATDSVGNVGGDLTVAELTIITNVPPVAVDDVYAGSEDTELLVDQPANGLLANDLDLDGDTLTVNTTPVVAPGNGTVVINADGTFSYTPNMGFTGIDSFTYSISDGNGNTAQATVTINVAAVNQAPQGVSDQFTTVAGLPVLISELALLANDIDADGDLLSIVSVTQPGYGSLAADGAGNYIYTPGSNFDGIDFFTYTVADESGETSVVPVSLFVSSSATGLPDIDPDDGGNDPGDEPDQTAPDDTDGAVDEASKDPVRLKEIEDQPDVPVQESLNSVFALANFDDDEGELVFVNNESGERSVIDNLIRAAGAANDGEYADRAKSLIAQILNINMDDEESSTALMWEAFDKAWGKMQNQPQQPGEFKQLVVFQSATGISVLLTAGYVTWALRGGALLSLLLSTMPVWKSFDPMPILLGRKGDDDSAPDSSVDEGGAQNAANVEGLFGALEEAEPWGSDDVGRDA